MRGVLLATLGSILIGTGLALLFGGAVNGLPAGWGGAFGLSFASLVEIGIALIGEPAISEPFRIVAVSLLGLGGLFLWYFGLGLRIEERRWPFTRRKGTPGVLDDLEGAETDQPHGRRGRARVIKTGSTHG